MTRVDFDKEVENGITDLRGTLLRKGSDYATHDDVFKNLRQVETLTGGRVSLAMGIFTRITDKISRIGNLLDAPTDPAVTNESLEDSVDDLLGYGMLLRVALRDRAGVTEDDGFGDGGEGAAALPAVVPIPVPVPVVPVVDLSSQPGFTWDLAR